MIGYQQTKLKHLYGILNWVVMFTVLLRYYNLGSTILLSYQHIKNLSYL